ncbi:MAG TPA: IS1595 family transposase [Rhizomicrobium sp.]|jgi:transposase-like protein|nr:IS1595 family transposase [Rhizomicrobium sp.]
MAAKIPTRFTDPTAARKHLEKLLWANGRPCPHCGTLDESTALQGKSTRPGVYWCNACQKPFSVTVGTVMESSKLPLNIWLYVNHLLWSSKKGISAHQIARMVGITYKSAWFLCHRLREAGAPKSGSEPPLGGDGFVVEADETYIGKKDGPKGRKHPGSGGYAHKRTVLSLVERGGKIKSFKLGGNTRAEILPVIRANVDPASTLHTDGAQVYKYPGMAHEAVDHNKEYVRDGVHTNTLEGFFSVFKRGMVGTYQHCGEQHLQRYLAEFDFRMNNRIALGIDDAERADIALQGITGKRLTYRRINAA